MSPSRTARSPWVAFSLLAATAFVLILDAAIVNVAIPSIRKDLHFNPEDLSWVTNAYTLTFGGFLLLGGRLSDLLGRRKLFVIGIALFTVASLAGALATTSVALIIARAVQGFGAALVSPAALALIMSLFEPGAARNKALGIWGSVAGAGAAAGSILGGALTDWFGWEAVLWVNVPIGAAAIVLTPMLLPEVRGEGGARKFDIPGAITVTAGLALLVYTLVDAVNAGWASGQTLGLGAASIALLALFVVIEARSTHPLLPLRIFKVESIRSANIIAIMLTGTMFSMFFFITLYMQQVLNMKPIEAGLGQLPIALMFAFGANIVSKIVTKMGYKPPLITGLVLISAGLAWLSTLRPDGTWLIDVLGPTLVMGAGGALAFVAIIIAATSGAQPSEAGLASGLMNTTQQVGGALGLAVFSTIATNHTLNELENGTVTPATALTQGYSTALIVAAAVAAFAAIVAVLLVSTKRNSTPPAVPTQGVGEPEPVAVGV